MNRPENMTAERRLKKRLSDSAAHMSEERKEKKREVTKMPIMMRTRYHKWNLSVVFICATLCIIVNSSDKHNLHFVDGYMTPITHNPN